MNFFLELEKSNVKIENLEKKQKEKNKLNTSISNVYKELNIPTSNKYNEVAIASTSKTIECNDNFDIDITKKRNYDELFGDISDMLDINTFGMIFFLHLQYAIFIFKNYIYIYIYIILKHTI